MSSPAQIEAFIRATRPPWNKARQAHDWYGMCAGLTYRTILECGGEVPDGTYNSAWQAYLATTIESTDPRKAPPGAVHYWDYTGMASNGQTARWGHVTLDILGGGTDTLGATGHAHEVWNTSAGLISVAAQTARGMTYMGWSRTYGRRNRLTITTGSAAGGSSKPLPTPIPKEVLEMSDKVIVTEKDNNNRAIPDNRRRAAFVNSDSGFACDISWLTFADADKWAKQVGMPAGALRLSDDGFDKYLARLADVRK